MVKVILVQCLWSFWFNVYGHVHGGSMVMVIVLVVQWLWLWSWWFYGYVMVMVVL